MIRSWFGLPTGARQISAAHRLIIQGNKPKSKKNGSEENTFNKSPKQQGQILIITPVMHVAVDTNEFHFCYSTKPRNLSCINLICASDVFLKIFSLLIFPQSNTTAFHGNLLDFSLPFLTNLTIPPLLLTKLYCISEKLLIGF